jgi:predicted transcriptional regulator
VKTIELPDDVYRVAQQLAERCECTIETVIWRALLDAQDLADQIERHDLTRLGVFDL